MTKYYFLATALPDLELGQKPDIDFVEFSILCKENLTRRDLLQMQVLREYYDIINVRDYWLEGTIDPYGNYDLIHLEDALLNRQGLPQFVYTFMDQYPHKKERIAHFPELFATYFHYSIKASRGFVKKYMSFERDMRLIFAAFRAKKIGRDITEELRYEDPEDPIVAQILAFKDAKTYEPPEPYEDLKPIFDKYSDSPLDLFQALTKYRFDKVESFHGVDVFSLDRIMGYMIQLILVEGWLKLDQKRGREIVENIIKGTS